MSVPKCEIHQPSVAGVEFGPGLWNTFKATYETPLPHNGDVLRFECIQRGPGTTNRAGSDIKKVIDLLIDFIWHES